GPSRPAPAVRRDHRGPHQPYGGTIAARTSRTAEPPPPARAVRRDRRMAQAGWSAAASWSRMPHGEP
ncbi:hypothetical protein ACWDUI_35310, partial [Streptosporangium sandarakinum]